MDYNVIVVLYYYSHDEAQSYRRFNAEAYTKRPQRRLLPVSQYNKWLNSKNIQNLNISSSIVEKK